jgi:hypothetical protein
LRGGGGGDGGGAHQPAGVVSAVVIDATGDAAGCQKLGAGSASGVPFWLDSEPQLEERRPPIICICRIGVGFSSGGSGAASSASFVAADSVRRASAAAAAAAAARSPKWELRVQRERRVWCQVKV